MEFYFKLYKDSYTDNVWVLGSSLDLYIIHNNDTNYIYNKIKIVVEKGIYKISQWSVYWKFKGNFIFVDSIFSVNFE